MSVKQFVQNLIFQLPNHREICTCIDSSLCFILQISVLYLENYLPPIHNGRVQTVTVLSVWTVCCSRVQNNQP